MRIEERRSRDFARLPAPYAGTNRIRFNGFAGAPASQVCKDHPKVRCLNNLRFSAALQGAPSAHRMETRTLSVAVDSIQDFTRLASATRVSRPAESSNTMITWRPSITVSMTRHLPASVM